MRSDQAERGRRLRPAVQPALRDVDVEAAQPLGDLARLDALRDDVEPDGVRHLHDAADDRGVLVVAVHVAGIAAQMIQANPALTPPQVEDILEDTASPFTFGGTYEADPANPGGGLTSFDKGHGLVDAVAAVNQALALR